MIKLERLKVNNQYHPCIDQDPYFSWIIMSDKNNVMQSSYHIIVKSEEEIFWDSGIVYSGKSAFVEYEGKKLQSLVDYNWYLEVTDNYGERMVYYMVNKDHYISDKYFHIGMTSIVISPMSIILSS